MKHEQSVYIKRSLILSNIKFYLSSISIIFFYSLSIFIIYILIAESNILAEAFDLTGVLVRGDYNYSPSFTFIIHFFILILSIITIDLINYERTEVSNTLLTILITSLITRKLLLILISGDNLLRGYIIGLQFYSPSIIALIPYITLSLRNNTLYNLHNNLNVFVLLIILLIFELFIDAVFNLIKLETDLLPILINIGSVFLAFFIFYFIKSNRVSYSFKNKSVIGTIKLISIIMGIPVVALFFLFA